MAKVTTYTKTGNKASQNATLSPEIFAVDAVSYDLLKQVYTAQHSNARTAQPRAKTRSRVRGGGKKPWRQKGTGRARAGSNRSPLWRGGGVMFGPTGNQNHTRHVTQAAKRTALKYALTLKHQSENVLVIEDVSVDGKTKSLRGLLEKLPVRGRTVLVVDEMNPQLKRSASNLVGVEVVTAAELESVRVLDADWIMFNKPSLRALEGRLGVSA